MTVKESEIVTYVVHVAVIHACSARSLSLFSRLVLAVLTTRLTVSVDHPSARSALAAAILVITVAGPLIQSRPEATESPDYP